MNKSPPRASIFGRVPRKSLYPPSKGFRKSQVQLAPIKIFMSNNQYYNYNLERISYPHSGNYMVVGNIQEAPALKVKKRESIIKEPVVLSYQKVNVISYKIAHTACVDGENINSDHICKLDHESMRCLVCGCHMGWIFTADRMSYPQPVRIDYYDYESIFFEENFSSDTFISLKSIRNLLILRKFFSYIAERPAGIGFQELYEKYKLINVYPIQVYKELGISYRELIEKKNEDFRIFADFEGANLQAYFFSIEDDICKIRFLMRGDTNMTELENTLWFYFKIVVKRSLRIEFEILNYKEPSKILGDQGVIFVFDERFIDPNENYFPGKARWRPVKEEVFFQTNEYRTSRYRSISVLDEENKSGRKENIDDLNIHNNNSIIIKNFDDNYGDVNCDIDAESKKKNEGTENLKKNEETNFNKEIETQNKENNENQIMLKKKFFSLKFHYVFDKANKNTPEEVLFAFGVPYTYNDLVTFLARQEKRLFAKAMQEQDFDLKTKRIFLRNDLIHYERSVISHTRCGVPIFLLKITSSITADETDKNDYFPISSKKRKKNIVFFARQHPYETPSSWIMEGIIMTLLNDTKKINLLRTFFNFYIVPMINVDGVMIGNSVTSVSGANLNRIWNEPIKDVNPEVFHIKEYFTNFQGEIVAFFDIHSSNNKSGVFLYGNSPSLDMNTCVLNEENIEKYLCDFGESLLLPKIFAQNSSYFNIAECKYRVEDKEKENTARNIFHKQLKIKHCFSLISSLYNYHDTKEKYIKDFRIEDFKNIGKDTLNVLFSFMIIMAETWVAKEKKTLEKLEKSKESNEASTMKRTIRRDKPKEEIKLTKGEERDKYFYHHLQNIKKEFDLNTEWKSYFNEKELKFMRSKAKKRLIPLNMLQLPDKKKKKNEHHAITFTKKKQQNEMELSDFIHNMIVKYEEKEEIDHDVSQSHNFFDGNISVDSERENTKEKQKSVPTPKNKNKQMMGFYKNQMVKNGSFIEKGSKSQSFLQLNNSSEILIHGKERSLLNSSILYENTTSRTTSNIIKKERENNSLDKSLSFNNKSTHRLVDLTLTKSRLFKNKSSLNLHQNQEILQNETDNLNKSSNPLLANTEKSTLATFTNINMAKTLLFKRSEFMKKIREKLLAKKEIQIDELKKLKIPIRRNIRSDSEKIEKVGEHGIENRKLQWRLRRPCSQGLIPINPFIKHKKELINLYSFHYTSNSMEKNSKNEENVKQIIKIKRGRNNEQEEPLETEELKKLEGLQAKTERKTVSLSPWSQKRTENQ